MEVVDVIHTYQAQVIDEVTQRDYDGEDIPSKLESFDLFTFETIKFQKARGTSQELCCIL